MNVPLLLGYIALAMVVLGVSIPVNGFNHQIYVSCSSSETIGNDTCRPSHDGLYCTTLDQAFKELQHNSTVVYIKSGICSLSKEVHFQYKTDIAIIGDDDGGTNVVIECSYFAGLSFSYSSNIILESLTLRQCGAFQNSSSRNIRKDIVFKYFRFTSALYMLFCANVTLIDVHLHDSNGIGLVLYNTVGNVIIKGCVFFNQSDAFPNQTTVVGGGGLQIEFSYCIPGNLNCLKSGHSQVDSQYSSGALYVITDSIFKLNQAHRGSEFVFKLRNEESGYFAFGKGGGLSIILKGNAHDNNFLISNCTFYKNYAHYGGGFYVAFHDQSRANRVSITDCNITANEDRNDNYSNEEFQDSMTMEKFPDRVLNPTEYQERHVGFVSSESSPSSLNSSQIHLQNPASGHSSNDSQTNDTRFKTSSRTTVQIGNTAKANTTSRTTFQTSIRSSVRNTTSDYGSTRTDDS